MAVEVKGMDAARSGASRVLRVFEWYLDARGAGDVLVALGLGSIAGDLGAWGISWLKGLPDGQFWPLALLLTLIVSWLIGHLISRAKSRISIPSGAPAATATDHSGAASGGRDAASANASDGATALSGVFHGPVTVINGPRVKLDEGEQASPKNLPPVVDATAQRALWLAGLASWRNVGVAKRNSLLALTGDEPEERANVVYTAWLIKVIEWIRQLPVNGIHEAHAFETLDRFSMDAAPAGTYANETVRWITAMFSTHLERLEELRKRYARTD